MNRSIADMVERLVFTPMEDSCFWVCETCGTSITVEDWPEGERFPHKQDCVWLAIPKIVAALRKIESELVG